MSIQILQYEFLGPIPLNDWGPPMEKLVFLIMSRSRDRFSILYAGDCEETKEVSFFVQHDRFKCWVQQSGSDHNLHLAILPMFEADTGRRRSVLRKIIAHYKPPCNPIDPLDEKPAYRIRRPARHDDHTCTACGSEMKPEQAPDGSIAYRCARCGSTGNRPSP